jgi:hypothetical protein
MQVVLKQETKECTAKQHSIPSRGSIYPKREVPKNQFYTDPNNPTGREFSTCFNCRKHQHKSNVIYRAKKLENAKTKYESLSSEEHKTHFYCSEERHDTFSGHLYPKYKIPLDEFRKEPGNIHSELFKQCAGCRRAKAINDTYYMNQRKEIANNQGLFHCIGCRTNIKDEERGLNIDGSKSIYCPDCKEASTIRSSNIMNSYNKIKLEMIESYQCSCYKCKRIYLQPDGDSIIVQQFETYLKDDSNRYITFNNREYLSSVFIYYVKHLLELSVTALDHLDEEEQRSRGLLLPGEIFIPKKSEVSQLQSESAMRLETRKCQLLCIKCHVEETIRREEIHENNSPYNKNRPLFLMKLAYITELKSKGCSSCRYINTDLLRFFETNHINPNDKRFTIGYSMRDLNISFESFVQEVHKCEILCAFCHKMLTKSKLEME